MNILNSEVKSGEPRVMWQVAYEEHGPSIFAFLKSRLANKDDAEDLLQETFVRAIKASETLRDRGKVRPFLFSIAHNLMVNHVRKLRELPLDENASGSESSLTYADMQSLSPEESTSLHDLEEHLQKAMDKMAPAHRQAFEMGVIQQKPYAEIARIAGWSLAQVKINVYRARKSAIAELGDEWDRPGV